MGATMVSRSVSRLLDTGIIFLVSLCVATGQEPVEVTATQEGVVTAVPAAGPPVQANTGPGEMGDKKPPEGQPQPMPPGGPNQPPGGPQQPGSEEKPDGATKEGTPPAVVRPDKPSGPGNPAAFAVRPDADGRIQFQFDGAPWPQLIEWLGEVSGMAVDWQKLPGDYVNLRTQRRYTVAETRDLINRHLLARGYTILQEGELLTIVPTEGINTALVPRVTEEQLPQCMPHEFVRISFKLDWLLAEEAANELKPLISKNGQLIPLRTTNRIEVVDAARNLQQIQRILQEEQSPDSEERLLREFVLEHVRATHVQSQLEQILGTAKTPQAPLSPEQQAQMQQMQMQMQQARMQQQMQQGQPNATLPQREEPEIQIVVNQQRNSVIVQAPPDKMAVIAEAVRLLDVPDRRAVSLDAIVGSIRTYRLETLNPEEVVEILLETGAMDPDTRLKVDQKSRAIIVSGPPWDHLTVEKLIKKLDGSPRAFKVVRLRRRRADQVATTVENLMIGPQEDQDQNRRRYPFYGDWWNRGNSEEESQDRFRVGADVEHNWLLLWCNETEHEHVMELLAELGEVPGGSGRPEQVRVLDSLDAETADQLLRRAREAFRSMAPNPVELPSPAPVPSESTETEEGESPVDPSFTPPAGAPSLPTVTSQDGSGSSPSPAVRQVASLSWLAQAEESRGSSDPRAREADGGWSAASRDEWERGPAETAPPITVVREADGRIILQSSDTAALDVFEELLEDLRPPNKDYAVFKLQYASASWVVLQLEDFFDEQEEDDRGRFPFFFFLDEPREPKQSLGLSDRRPIRFISDIDTNTIIVRNATDDQLATVQELVTLYDIREPVNKEKSRHTKLIAVKYSKASVIADQVKDVFRDLLSGNDKAFQQQNAPNQQRQRSDSGGIFAQGLAFGEGDAETQSDTRASFQGKLSIGVDDTTNTLLVSTEGETLMKLVVAMIEDLDRAAQPADNVRVVRLRPGSNYGEIRNALRGTFGLSPAKTPEGAEAAQPDAPSQPAQKPPATPEEGRVPPEG